jgi:hypothetical protein
VDRAGSLENSKEASEGRRICGNPTQIRQAYMRGFCRIGQEIKGNRAGIDPVGEFDFGTGGRMLPVFFVRVRDGGDGGFLCGPEALRT